MSGETDDKNGETPPVLSPSKAAVAAPGSMIAPIKKQRGLAIEHGGALDISQEEFGQSMLQIDNAAMENIESGEIQISRLAVAQPTTPEVIAQTPGWRGGLFYDNVTREPFICSGKPPWMLAKGIDPADLKTMDFLPIVVLFRLPTEYVLWPTKEERKAGIRNFHWKTLDAADPRVREGIWAPKGIWKGTGSPPVTEHLNLLSLVLSLNGEPLSNFIVESFSRTNFKPGKKLVTNVAQHKLNSLPWWGRVYYLYNELKQWDEGSSYVTQFAKGPKLKDFCGEANSDNYELVFSMCYGMARQLSDPVKGKILQEMMINAAAIGEDQEVATPSNGEVGESETDDPSF